jgi:hypothetical protein
MMMIMMMTSDKPPRNNNNIFRIISVICGLLLARRLLVLQCTGAARLFLAGSTFPSLRAFRCTDHLGHVGRQHDSLHSFRSAGAAAASGQLHEPAACAPAPRRRALSYTADAGHQHDNRRRTQDAHSLAAAENATQKVRASPLALLCCLLHTRRQLPSIPRDAFSGSRFCFKAPSSFQRGHWQITAWRTSPCCSW